LLPHNKQRGLTLIEVVVVVSLIGVLSAVVVGFSTQAMRSMRAGQTAQLVQSDLRFALSYMTRELLSAESVSVSPDKRRITYTKPGQAPREFEQTGDTIQRWDDQPLCSYVDLLRFTLQGNILSIEIESVAAVSGVSEGGLPIKLRTSVRLRNTP